MRAEKNGRHRAVKGKKAFRWKNKTEPPRASLEVNEARNGEGGGLVVKGVSRRVIVVRSPDERIFEQAIFIIREDYACQAGVSEKEVLRQARRAANEYLRGGRSRVGWGLRFRAPLFAAAGAALTGIAWLATQLVHF